MKTHFQILAVLACSAVATAQDGAAASGPPAQTQSLLASGVTDVIYSNFTGLPNAQVPGLGGVEFNAGTASSSAFDRPFASPNGNWILTGFAETASTSDDELILVNGVVVAREGDPAPWTVSDNMGFFDQRVGINDAGQFAFANNVLPATTTDDYMIRGEPGGTFTLIAQEGSAIPALPGATYGSGFDSPTLLADGRIAFEADFIGGTTSTTNNLVVLDSTLVAQNNVTIPAGQAGGASEFWENFNLNEIWFSADGAISLIIGDLTGSTTSDQVLVLNGTVVLQEFNVVPGSGFADPIDSSGIVNCSLDHGGNWYARGNNDISEQDWVVRNGAVIATLGQPITTGASELWDDTDFADCYFMHVGNAVGDWIIGGVTDAVSTANGVLVKNGTDVIARESDPVDLDGNGLFDDDAFINTFGDDDAFLTDSGDFYFTATVKNGAGTVVGSIFAKLATGSTATAYCFGDGSGTACPCGNTGAPGRGCANSTASGGALLASSGSVSVGAADLVLVGSGAQPNQPGLYFQGDNAINGGNGITNGDGLRCAGGGLRRLQVVNADVNGDSQTTVDIVALGLVSPGDTKRYQWWYRNPAVGAPCGTGFNLSNGLEVVWTP